MAGCGGEVVNEFGGASPLGIWGERGMRGEGRRRDGLQK